MQGKGGFAYIMASGFAFFLFFSLTSFIIDRPFLFFYYDSI